MTARFLLGLREINNSFQERNSTQAWDQLSVFTVDLTTLQMATVGSWQWIDEEARTKSDEDTLDD